MTSKRRTRQRGRRLDDRDGCLPSPPRPRLSSTGSGGWSRPSAADGPPTDATATPARPSYADAATHPRATTAPSNPVAQLSPLHGEPSLRPRPSLRPLALAAWQPGWNDDNDAVNDGASDEDSDVGGSKETKHDDTLMVDETAVANRDVNAHTAEDDTPDGSNSPPLLSIPPSPKPFLVDAPAALHHHVAFDAGASYCVTNADIAMPPGDNDPMAALNRAISAHLFELDSQQRAIGDKYDAFHALLVTAQAAFDAPAIKLRVRSAIGAHTAPFSELTSQAESAIDRKYDEINALHVTSKSTISSAMMLLDAPALSQWALAAVDDAIRAATAPDGLLDQRIGESIASVVDPDGLLDQRIGESIALAVSLAVTSTLDEIFVSYWTCVLEERHAAEADLISSSLHATRKSAETDFKDAIATTTSDSIDTLNATIRSAAAECAAKQDSVVNAITHAQRGSVDTTPVTAPPPPPHTGLEALADNATPAGLTRVVWANSQAQRLPTTSMSPPIIWMHLLPTIPPRRTPPPARAHDMATTPRVMGGLEPITLAPHYPAGGHNGWPASSPTNSTSHSPRPHSDVRSERYHCSQHGLDEFIPLSEQGIPRLDRLRRCLGVLRAHAPPSRHPPMLAQPPTQQLRSAKRVYHQVFCCLLNTSPPQEIRRTLRRQLVQTPCQHMRGLPHRPRPFRCHPVWTSA